MVDAAHREHQPLLDVAPGAQHAGICVHRTPNRSCHWSSSATYSILRRWNRRCDIKHCLAAYLGVTPDSTHARRKRCGIRYPVHICMPESQCDVFALLCRPRTSMDVRCWAACMGHVLRPESSPGRPYRFTRPRRWPPCGCRIFALPALALDSSATRINLAYFGRSNKSAISGALDRLGI